jgi:hypothetical protein
MWPLQRLLTLLDGQKLLAGTLPVYGSGTALETVTQMILNTSPYYLLSNPIGAPGLLNCPAWVSSVTGTNAIYLAGVDGNLSKSAPAFTFG